MSVQTDHARQQLHRVLQQDVKKLRDAEASRFEDQAGAAPLVQPLVVFGAGTLGRKTLAGLRSFEVEPVCFSDNNQSLWGSAVEGITVLSPAEAASRYGESAVFVVSIWSPGKERNFRTIKSQLEGLGCKRVIPFVPLYWRYHEAFLPHYRIDLPHRLVDAASAVEQAYDLLADDESREEYVRQIQWMTSTEFPPLEPMHSVDETYFPPELFTLSDRERFFDCGAFDGDTIRAFLSRSQNFSSIVAFEPDAINLKRLVDYVAGLPAGWREKISVRAEGIGATDAMVTFATTGTVGSTVTASGQSRVHVVRLDDVLGECQPTYIKMDIEGAEVGALAGAAGLIKQWQPKLAVCIYHRQSDLWEIPLLLHGICDSYKFYLRRYGDEFGDVVCYALPPEK